MQCPILKAKAPFLFISDGITCNVKYITLSILKGNLESQVAISEEKRAIIRPMGVVSKKVGRERRIPFNITL